MVDTIDQEHNSIQISHMIISMSKELGWLHCVVDKLNILISFLQWLVKCFNIAAVLSGGTYEPSLAVRNLAVKTQTEGVLQVCSSSFNHDWNCSAGRSHHCTCVLCALLALLCSWNCCLQVWFGCILVGVNTICTSHVTMVHNIMLYARAHVKQQICYTLCHYHTIRYLSSFSNISTL